MKMYVIAVHYSSLDKKNITGFRILDADTKEVKDFDYRAVSNVLIKKLAPIEGLCIDNRTKNIKGSNGALDRYPALYNGKPMNRSLVILNSIDDIGYTVSSFNGKIVNALRSEVALFASKNGIANGKVVEKDGKKFISAISGTYTNIPFDKSDLAKNKQVQMRRNDEKIAKQVVEVERKNIAKRQVKQILRPKVITDTNVDPELMQMLDDVSGQTVEQKMTYSMLALKATRPFCYSVYVCLNHVASTSLSTMGVSLRTLYFNPYFVLRTSIPELLYILVHEIYHISMKHKIREKGRQHKLWNKACDYYINKQIAEEFELTEIGEVKQVANEKKNITGYKIAIPFGVLYNKKVNVDTDTPESIYEELLNIQHNKQKKKQSQSDNQNQQGQEQQNQQGQSENDSDNQESDDNQDNNQSNGNDNRDNNQSNGNDKQNNKQDEQNKQSNKQDKQEGQDTNSPLDDLADGKEPSGDNEDFYNDDTDDDSNDEEGSQGKNSEESNNEESDTSGEDIDDISGEYFRGEEIPDIEEDIVDSPEEQGETSDRAEQIANSILKRAASICRQQKGSFGGETGSWIEREVEKVLAPKVMWQSLLRNKLTLASQKVNTFAAPDKRFRSRGMILPGPKKLENDTLENIKVCIDTSGSISNEDLGVALAQIDQLLRVFKADAELMYWDTQIRAIYPFKKIKDLLDKKPMGGGGTDANCIFSYFEEERDYKIGKKQKPKIIIIFTDGYIGTVSSKYNKYKDTIWIINGNPSFEAPFGVKAPFKYD